MVDLSVHIRNNLRPRLFKIPVPSTAGKPGFVPKIPEASICLSPTLRAVFSDGESILSPIQLGQAGLSIHQAWQLSCENLLDWALWPTGTRFWVRKTAGGWFDIAVTESTAASWVAHPQTFRILDDFLKQHFGGTVTYHLPTKDASVLYARCGGVPVQNDVFVFHNGFPVALKQLASTPAQGLLRPSLSPA